MAHPHRRPSPNPLSGRVHRERNRPALRRSPPHPQTQLGLPRLLRPLLSAPASAHLRLHPSGHRRRYLQPPELRSQHRHQLRPAPRRTRRRASVRRSNPLRGWLLDADTFKTRVNNFLDHSNIGDSSIYFPVTVDGALVRAWELSLRSPRLWHFGQAHLAYSNQIAQQRGAITGGLICSPPTSAECDVDPGYTPVDHDQRNTLNVGFNATLPWRTTASTNVYYGSGFTNGGFDPNGPPADPRYPNPYLPEHTTFDLSIGKTFNEKLTASVTATNVANRRVLLDNSLTFGGFHFNDPREIFGELRYRFKY
ncbi:TonB-dependent receptor domain-containing protein [Tunturiibacter gelidiferens]|uniref:TonB-dependent receptor domain-containing protein n=1 Tax=Tunturiibacter gelidiferens TaxID=3069689 RepID=UPI003D9B4F77